MHSGLKRNSDMLRCRSSANSITVQDHAETPAIARLLHCRYQAHMQASSFPIGETLLEAFARATILHVLLGSLPLLSGKGLVSHLAGVARLRCARLLARRTAATLALR